MVVLGGHHRPATDVSHRGGGGAVTSGQQHRRCRRATCIPGGKGGEGVGREEGGIEVGGSVTQRMRSAGGRVPSRLLLTAEVTPGLPSELHFGNFKLQIHIHTAVNGFRVEGERTRRGCSDPAGLFDRETMSLRSLPTWGLGVMVGLQCVAQRRPLGPLFHCFLAANVQAPINPPFGE